MSAAWGQEWNPIVLTRDCAATTVPAGDRVLLSAGGEVALVQQLGGSFTVKTEWGNLLRIDGTDADALGLEIPEQSIAFGTAPSGEFHISHVMNALQSVYDPEIPVSIVELGLIYRCEEFELEGGRRRIEIDMTMTAPGCGMGDVLKVDAERAVAQVGGVDEVEVFIVWDPPWSMGLISEAARLQLGLL
ncbi:MAG: putative Fe-S cluster assembly protein SufT [Acidimicrobiia bacterium]